LVFGENFEIPGMGGVLRIPHRESIALHARVNAPLAYLITKPKLINIVAFIGTEV
jgi:hypothetical protein